jgi:hypothetical protein
MAQKTDSVLMSETIAKFTSGSDQWTGQELEDALVDIIDSKVNNDELGSATLPANVYYLSQEGCVSDANLSLESSTFGTDNTSAIQAVLDNGGSNPILVYVDGKYSATHLTVKSNTTIICFEGCGFIQRDNSNRTFLINSSPQTGSYGNENIKIIGGIWNFNAMRGATYYQIKTNTTYGWVVGFRFAGIKNLVIDGCTLLNSRNFMVFISWFKDVRVQNSRLENTSSATSNTDGVKFLTGSNAIVKNIFAKYLKDDVFSFCANDVFYTTYPPPAPIGGGQTEFDPYTTSGTIEHCTADTIYAEDCNNFFRLFSGLNEVRNIFINNLISQGSNGTGGGIIDNYAEGPQNMEPAGDGVFSNITIQNVIGKVNYKQCVIWVSGNVRNLSIKGLRIYRHENGASYYGVIFDNTGQTGGTAKTCNNVIIEMQEIMEVGTLYDDTSAYTLIKVDNGYIVKKMILQNIVYDRAGMTTRRATPVLKLVSGTITNLIMNQVCGDRIENIVEQTGGTLSYIHATNIVHKDADGNATFEVSGTVVDAFMSGYYGFTRTGGAGSITTTRGDGFTGALPTA